MKRNLELECEVLTNLFDEIPFFVEGEENVLMFMPTNQLGEQDNNQEGDGEEKESTFWFNELPSFVEHDREDMLILTSTSAKGLEQQGDTSNFDKVLIYQEQNEDSLVLKNEQIDKIE